VVIAFDGNTSFERTLLDRSTWRGATASRQMDRLEVVNLPSREWITLSLMDELHLEDARKLTECDGAWLRGYFPDGRRFSQRVPFAADPQK
jgi:hypothetical protein